MTLLLISALCGYSQILIPVKWSYASKKLGNSDAVLLIKADMDKGWHIYSQHVTGPIKTVFKFKTDNNYSLIGNTTEPAPITKYEDLLKATIQYFEQSVIFQQKIKLKKTTSNVGGSVSFLVCNDKHCLPPESVEFTIPVK